MAVAWFTVTGPRRSVGVAEPDVGARSGIRLERAGDNLGAVAGPLLAAGLVDWIGVRPTLYLAAVPGIFAALAIVLAARESRRRGNAPGGPAARRLDLRALRDAGMLRALTPVLLFAFGNLAATLLILRATESLSSPHRSVTAATSLAVLIYAGHNVVATLASLIAGRWYDRAGHVWCLLPAAIYVIAYGVFATGSHSVVGLVLAFCAAGAGIGLAEPTESAVVAQLLPDELRGSGFGVLGVIQAAGDVVPTVVAGFLYTLASPALAFGYAAEILCRHGVFVHCGNPTRRE